MICILALCLTAATAVDGDTLKHRGQNYRIWGIDAPERGDSGGADARDTLTRLIEGQTLVCEQLDTDRYRRPVLRCDLPSGRDLACELVRLGAAEDWLRYSKGAYQGCRK